MQKTREGDNKKKNVQSNLVMALILNSYKNLEVRGKFAIAIYTIVQIS